MLIDSKPQAKARFSWGWVVVVAATLMTFGFYGASGSFGVFLKPIEESLHLTRASASIAMSIFLGVSGLTGIVSGRLTDKYGPRVVIGVGAVIGFLGYLLMYQTNSLWQLYLFFGVMAGASMGTCFTPVIATVSKWFTGKRVLAVGITTIGIAIGQMSIPLLAAYFITNNGWRPAYIILAIVVLIASIPGVTLLGKKLPQTTGVDFSRQDQLISQKVDAKDAGQSRGWSPSEVVRTLPFWMFIIIGFVTAAGFYIIMVHIVAYAIEVGVVAVNAALIITIMNIGTIASQFLVWFLARKISSRFTIIIMQGLQAVALYALMGMSSFYGIIILGLIFGFGFGGSNTVRLAMISEVFGIRSVGSIIGLVSIAWAFGGLVGPMLAGYIFDLSHSYFVAFLVGGLLLTMGATSGFFLRAPRAVNRNHVISP